MRIEDIARIANVSKSAVSLALNNKPGVSEETRQHILEIVEKYNYVPLRQAKRTKISETGLIRFIACKNEDIITDDYENQPFFSELIGHLTEEMKMTNYSLIISSINSDDIDNEIIQLEKEQEARAIILLGTNLSKEAIVTISKIKKPIVVIDTCFPELDVDFISINNYQGAFQAAKHLLREGHTKVGYAQSHSRVYNFEQRKKGFLSALAEQNIELNNRNFFEFAPMKIATDYTFKASDFLHQGQPTVIFCENDYIAISLIKTLNHLDISVPQDISVIGFDNISETKVISPELTTVHVDKNSIAKEALKRISELITDTNTTSYHGFISTKLIVRDSIVSQR